MEGAAAGHMEVVAARREAAVVDHTEAVAVRIEEAAVVDRMEAAIQGEVDLPAEAVILPEVDSTRRVAEVDTVEEGERRAFSGRRPVPPPC